MILGVLMSLQKQFDSAIQPLSRYDYRNVFRDMCRMGALSVANSIHTPSWKNREDEYMRIVRSYPKPDFQRVFELYCLIVSEIVNNPYMDILGELYTINKIGNARLGQYFTPLSVSHLMSAISMDNYEGELQEKGFISIYDCCSGAGGLLLSAAKVMAERGDDPANMAVFVAQDIDQCCADMTVIQMFYNNLSAVVQQGDSLSLKFADTIYTPQWFTTGLGEKFISLQDEMKNEVSK